MTAAETPSEVDVDDLLARYYEGADPRDWPDDADWQPEDEEYDSWESESYADYVEYLAEPGSEDFDEYDILWSEPTTESGLSDDGAGWD